MLSIQFWLDSVLHILHMTNLLRVVVLVDVVVIGCGSGVLPIFGLAAAVVDAATVVVFMKWIDSRLVVAPAFVREVEDACLLLLLLLMLFSLVDFCRVRTSTLIFSLPVQGSNNNRHSIDNSMKSIG